MTDETDFKPTHSIPTWFEDGLPGPCAAAIRTPEPCLLCVFEDGESRYVPLRDLVRIPPEAAQADAIRAAVERAAAASDPEIMRGLTGGEF